MSSRMPQLHFGPISLRSDAWSKTYVPKQIFASFKVHHDGVGLSDLVHGSHFRGSCGGSGCCLGCLSSIWAKSHVDPTPAANVMFETMFPILEMGLVE